MVVICYLLHKGDRLTENSICRLIFVQLSYIAFIWLFLILGGSSWQSAPFIVFISNNTLTRGVQNNSTTIYSGTPNNDDRSYLIQNINRLLRFVTVERNSSGHMTICEIRIAQTSKLYMNFESCTFKQIFFVKTYTLLFFIGVNNVIWTNIVS